MEPGRPPGTAADYEFTVIEIRLDAKGMGEGKTSLTTQGRSWTTRRRRSRSRTTLRDAGDAPERQALEAEFEVMISQAPYVTSHVRDRLLGCWLIVLLSAGSASAAGSEVADAA